MLNLVGAFLSVEVAKTISGGIVDDTKVTPAMIFAGLVGAILWNLVTWLLGLPSSSSHALFGGLIGATWIAAGADAVNFGEVVGKVLLPALASPLVAGIVAALGTVLAYRITARAEQGTVGSGFKVGQIVSSSLVALAHGTNDAQKTMGVITLTLIAAGLLAPDSGPPFWVILSAGSRSRWAPTSAAGGSSRRSASGSREIETPQGFAAETSTAAVILASSHLGFALSTTQVATGDHRRRPRPQARDVQWGVAGQMVVAWLLTLPAAAVVGAVAAAVSRSATGTILAPLAWSPSRWASTPRPPNPTTPTIHQRAPCPAAAGPTPEERHDIDWVSLCLVLVIALGSVVVLTSLFSFGLAGLSQRDSAREAGGSGTGPLAGAVVCSTVGAAIVAFGIFLIVA